MSQPEHELQNRIRNALVEDCLLYRANVGRGWTGDKVEKAHPYRKTTVVLEPGDVVIRAARPFDTGLPAGFHDLFGLTPVRVTPAHVGDLFGVFTSIEVKTTSGRVSPKQQKFGKAINAHGGFTGVARSVEDAKTIVRGGLAKK